MKSDLNVFGKAPYKWYDIFHQVKYFLGSIKCAWERATKGYCYRDLWNLDIFYAKLFEDSIREFNKTRQGYPTDMTDEEWGKYLNDMVDHFHNCLKSNEIYSNPYWDKYYHNIWELGESKDTPKNKELHNEWWKRCQEIDNILESEKDKAFDMMRKRFFDLWD